jgi:hypothetical protein
MRVIKT